MSRHSSPHDWLNLVQLSGLLVSEPVLATAFPDGPERVPSHVYRRFGREWERVSSTRNEAAAQSDEETRVGEVGSIGGMKDEAGGGATRSTAAR